MSPLRRLILDGHCYHTISVTRDRKPVFAEDAKAAIVLGAINEIRTKRVDVLAYCVLPDHLHLVLGPREPWTIAQVMQSIKGYSSRQINRLSDSKGRLWQPGYYDRIIRNEDHLQSVVNYVEANPVEAGLVSKAEEYRWSSANPAASTDIDRWLADDRGWKASATEGEITGRFPKSSNHRAM